MTERIYHRDSFVLEFGARISELVEVDARMGIVLDRTAFYPTSGGQVFDTGVIECGESNVRVVEVAEDDSGRIVHYLEPNAKAVLEVGATVHGAVDAERRRDHMQQHSGQHILSAAFEKLFKMPTVSFHMGDESCTIDLDTKGLTEQHLREAERDANRVTLEDRPVAIRSATVEQARSMGVRKIPDHVEGELRLIDIEGYDLNACGGTHVARTGQVGAILLRKSEKVKQGFRIEFVCGERTLRVARNDFEALTEAAALFTTQIWQVPELIRKSQEELKAAAKERKKLNEEIAELMAKEIVVSATETNGHKVIARVFVDRDINFTKLLAQKITSASPSVVLFGASMGQPGVVFAQTAGLPNDMGALMRQALVSLGGRGGGNRDLAQGGAADSGKIAQVIEDVAKRV